jgi:hypothetical protein
LGESAVAVEKMAFEGAPMKTWALIRKTWALIVLDKEPDYVYWQNIHTGELACRIRRDEIERLIGVKK